MRCILHPGNLLSILLFTFTLTVNAQDSTITGTVSSVDGENLPGVNVLVKGSSQGTITSVDGTYRIQASDNATLVFSFVGYHTKEVEVNGQSVINMVLEPDVQQLGEVVVIGYGEQSRETISTSVTKLDNEVLENVVYPNATSALQGALPGVRVQSTTGQPGASPRVVVRGGTSINNPNGANPLYVIDGVIRPDMNNIASEDIESIQVLKDAASTAIYGARGSNGVVVVTTKSGQSGKVRVNYSYDLTQSQVGRTYDLANARDYITLSRLGVLGDDRYADASGRNQLASGFGTGNDLTNNTAYTTQYLTSENEHKLNEGWESMPDPVDPSQTIIFKDTDWQDVLFRTAISHNHHLSVSGGSDKASFSASLGYLNSEGIAITSDYERYSLSLNGDVKASDNLSFFARAMLSRSTDNEIPSMSSVFARATTLPPTTKYMFEDGTLAPGQRRSEGNPEYFLTNVVNDNTEDNITLAFGSQWFILPGLSFEPQISFYEKAENGHAFQPSFYDGPSNYVDSRVASAYYSQTSQIQADAVLSYVNSFGGNHNLNLKAGYSYFGRKISGFNASGQGASTDLIPTLNASAEPTAVGGSISDRTILGYFSRVNYNYQYKYLLSLSMRYDGASNLGAENKWGFFPGISAGWNVHQEQFWSNVMPTEYLTNLKLRASYGINGNIGELGDFAAQGSYDVGSIYDGQSGINNTVIPNPALQWERSTTFDIGADLGLLNNRISLLVDYYDRETDNLLTDYTLPPSTGYNSILTNLGTLENKGFEIEIGAQVLPAKSSLQWNVSFNAAKVSNKILQLPDNGTENNRVGGYNVWDESVQDYVWKGGLQEGGNIGDYYEYYQLGVYATDEDAMSAPADIRASVQEKRGGNIIWQDSDGNGIIDSRDMVYMGNIYPKWTGGFTNTLSYKNFSLLARFDFTTGHTIQNYARGFMNGMWKLNMNMTQDMVDQSWREQGDVTNMSVYGWYSARGAADISPSRLGQFYYESGNFLAVRELTLTYNVPSSLLEKINIYSIRLNATGNNLHYFTTYKGLNPEEGGRDYGRYPVPRNITFGANITF